MDSIKGNRTGQVAASLFMYQSSSLRKPRSFNIFIACSFMAACVSGGRLYDYCVVDCGLIMDMTVTNVLIASDLVIVPVKIGGFEIEAAANMNDQLESLKDFNPDIHMKVLMTMRQKNQTTLQVEEWLKTQSGHDCFATAIRRSIIAEKSTVDHVPLPKFSKNCIVTQDYRAVTHELMKEV